MRTVFVAVLFIGAICSANSQVNGRTNYWMQMGSANLYGAQANATYRIYKAATQMVPAKVWVRLEVDTTKKSYAEVQAEMLKYLQRNDWSKSTKFTNLSYCMYLYELDCNDVQYKLLKYMEYDKDGKVLEDTDMPKKKETLEEIVPGSIEDVLQTYICR